MNTPRRKSVFAILCVSAFFLVAIFLILLAGCADRSDSLTAFVSQDCTQCHSAENTFSVAGAKAGYDLSAHATGGNSFYSNGNGCQRCHTHEGFIEFVATGSVDPESHVEVPSQPNCFTCHDPHKTGDFSLKVSEAITLDNGEIFDAGKGNLCSICHQARGDVTTKVRETEAANVSSRFGPHHGPQADMIAGTNAWEFTGKSYSDSVHTVLVRDTCVTCHMALPDGRYSLSPSIGSHSFNISGEVHGQEKVNTASCLECHQDMAQSTEAVVFDKLAAADYDNDGRIEPLQLEIEGLLQAFVNESGGGLLQLLSPPMYKADGSWNNVSDGTRSIEEMGALYNYNFVLEDRSLGIHNAKYAIQILYDSIEALDSSFDASNRPN